MGDRLSIRELVETLGWSPTHTWRRTKLEGFPVPTGTRRAGKGGAIVSLWNVDEVRAWEALMRAERLAHRDTVKQLRSAGAEARRLEVAAVVVKIRALRSEGLQLRAIAATLNVGYARVRRACLDIPVATPRAGRRREWSDAELIDALSAFGGGSIPQYDRWRSTSDRSLPSSATIANRFGSWSNAMKGTS